MKKFTYKVLLIDDDNNYIEQLLNEAKAYHLEIIPVNNLDSGIEILESNINIQAVILDSHCMIEPEQDPDSDKSNFIFHALHRLTDIEHVHNRFIPYCVNTEFPDEFKNELNGITQVFTKHKHHKELFEFVRIEIEAQPETLAINKHEKVFRFFDDYMNAEDTDMLLEVIVNQSKQDKADIVANFALLRRLEEKLFDVLAVNALGLNPVELDRQRMSRTKNIIIQFKNKRKIPIYLFDFAMDIYTVASIYGAHNPINRNQRISFVPGKYTVQSLLYAFLELIAWADIILDE